MLSLRDIQICYRAKTLARDPLMPCSTQRQRSCCAQHAPTAVLSLVEKSKSSLIGQCAGVAEGCYLISDSNLGIPLSPLLILRVGE